MTMIKWISKPIKKLIIAFCIQFAIMMLILFCLTRGLNARLDALVMRFDVLGQRVSLLEQEISHMEEELTVMEEEIQSCWTDYGYIKTGIDRMLDLYYD